MNRLFAKEDYFSHVVTNVWCNTLITYYGAFKDKIPLGYIKKIKHLGIRNFTNGIVIDLKYVSQITYLDCVNYISCINFLHIPNIKILTISLFDTYSINMDNLPQTLDLLLVKKCFKMNAELIFNFTNLPCGLKKIHFEYIDDNEMNWLIKELEKFKFPFGCEIYIANRQINIGT
jgi:hypothetical protein